MKTQVLQIPLPTDSGYYQGVMVLLFTGTIKSTTENSSNHALVYSIETTQLTAIVNTHSVMDCPAPQWQFTQASQGLFHCFVQFLSSVSMIGGSHY